jgi:hypothetical protein
MIRVSLFVIVLNSGPITLHRLLSGKRLRQLFSGGGDNNVIEGLIVNDPPFP